MYSRKKPNMKVRVVDTMGRIVLPIKIRKELGYVNCDVRVEKITNEKGEIGIALFKLN